MDRLSGKVAVATGAASGIGPGNGGAVGPGGAKIVLVDRNDTVEEVGRALGPRVPMPTRHAAIKNHGTSSSTSSPAGTTACHDHHDTARPGREGDGGRHGDRTVRGAAGRREGDRLRRRDGRDAGLGSGGGGGERPRVPGAMGGMEGDTGMGGEGVSGGCPVVDDATPGRELDERRLTLAARLTAHGARASRHDTRRIRSTRRRKDPHVRSDRAPRGHGPPPSTRAARAHVFRLEERPRT